MMLSNLIQRKVQLGSRAIFTLESGREISGTLMEIGREHITIENGAHAETVLTKIIVSWRILEEPSEPEKQKTRDSAMSAESNETVTDGKISENAIASSSVHSFAPTILKRLLEIEANFNAQINNSKIELCPPDFQLREEESEMRRNKDAQKKWQSIKDKYDNALKINELSSKFGRIQPIVNELKILEGMIPHSVSVKWHLAYFYHILGKQTDALKIMKHYAFLSELPRICLNTAVMAIRENQDELGCYCLERYFYKTPIQENRAAWFTLVKLINKFLSLGSLKNIMKMRGLNFSHDEENILIETIIFLHKMQGKEELALEIIDRWMGGEVPASLLKQFDESPVDQPSESYSTFLAEVAKETAVNEREEKQEKMTDGYIHKYLPDKRFGFIEGSDYLEYFFHYNQVADDELFKKLSSWSGEKISVNFEKTQGPKGPIAINITLYRSIPDIYELAKKLTQEGEYNKAIAQIKKILSQNPDYLPAQKLYEECREYARISGVPKGSNPYARAKRAQIIEKNLEKSEQLFREAIKKGDNLESAVKDLAALFSQQGHHAKAIEILSANRHKIKDSQSVDNLLLSLYQNAQRYKDLIDLLRNRLKSADTREKKAQINLQIGLALTKMENYIEAEPYFVKAIELQPQNLMAKRNLALCHYKNGVYEEAERLLIELRDTFSDPQAIELLDAIHRARTTGETALIEDVIVRGAISDLSSGISKFAQFLLDRCTLRGIPTERKRESENGRWEYTGSGRDVSYDQQHIEELARQSGTRRPIERAELYLSAAKIEESEKTNQFYQFLCRSFASKGDAVISENKHIDAARELYCESLNIYDGFINPRVREDRYDEQDAVNALVRFILSFLGRDEIPVSPPKQKDNESILKQQLHYVDRAIEKSIMGHPEKEKIFDALSYLISHSEYATRRVCECLFEKSSFQAMTLDFLENKGISIKRPVENLSNFVEFWNQMRKIVDAKERDYSLEFRSLSRIEFSITSLEEGIKRINTIEALLFFDLDKQRIKELQRILIHMLDMCRQESFEEKERLCNLIINNCKDLLETVEDCPTRLSVEETYRILNTIIEKTSSYYEELYKSSLPQLTIKPAIETYIPDSANRIDVQIKVANRSGCSPAEDIDLTIESESLRSIDAQKEKSIKSLRGGDQNIVILPIALSDNIVESKTFTLPLSARYKTRLGEIRETPLLSFSIKLYSEDEFEGIDNPYAPFAEGGVVSETSMFYGREEIIRNAASVIKEARNYSKCFVIYGQKRAGKSSILYHLKTQLLKCHDLLVLDVGNIGSLIDENSPYPFTYQFLWSILSKMSFAIEDKLDEGFPRLDFILPTDKEYYEHPSPLALFKNTFDQYKRNISRCEKWRTIRIVLLIDEFSYIYEYIITNKIPETFMKNWKALLQENYFSAVLAGQDVMPKFKQRFPNEFGTIQDERVTYLSREDAVRLIDEPVRIGGRQGESRYREKAIERILKLTAGSPFYIQIICNRLMEYMNRRKAKYVTEADIEHVKNELINGVNALEEDRFDNLLSSGDTSQDAISKEDAKKVLCVIAQNSEIGSCKKNSIPCETEHPIELIIEDLTKRDVIECVRGSYYSIKIDLFRDWLINH